MVDYREILRLKHLKYDKRDKLVKQCLLNGQYNIIEINIMLDICKLTGIGLY